MEKSELVPDMLPINVGYFDVDAFVQWFQEQYPERRGRVGTPTMARDSGVSRGAIRMMLKGHQPNLYTYCVMCAHLELPLGTFVRLRWPPERTKGAGTI